MNPRVAEKQASLIMLFNGLIGIFILGWAMKLSVDFTPEENPQTEQTTIPTTQKKKKTTLLSFSACWQAKILANSPPIERKVATTPKQTPKKVVAPPPPLAFEWVGVIIHSDPKRSCAILLDKRKNKQIIAKPGRRLPRSKYRIITITSEEVHFQYQETEVVLRRPEPLEKLVKHTEYYANAFWESLAVEDEKIMVVNSIDIEQYGFRDNDQIISIEGKKAADIDELRSIVDLVTGRIIRIIIRREGQNVLLLLPKEALR